MVSKAKWTSILFVLQAVLTASNLSKEAVGEVGIPHGTNITSSKSRKRQEIIFLRDDFTHKRNREGETMSNIEKHGKSLSAEGNVFKGIPKAGHYEDSSTYQGPALKGQSVKKDNGPPEIQEKVKKSDAYEVLSDDGLASEDENKGEAMLKVGQPLVKAHASDKHSNDFKGHRRTGMHIVSFDDDVNNDDEDNGENGLREKDLRLYGSIGSPSSRPIRHKSHRYRSHHTFYQNDYIPPNVVTLSQDDVMGPLSRNDAQTREEIFPNFRRRDPLFFSRPSRLTQPEELMQRFQPVSPKSISYGDRPNMLLLPMYNGNADSNPALVPMTAQSAFPASPPQFGVAPLEYTSPQPSGIFRSGLLLQSALQVPQIPAQSVTPSYGMPSQSDGQIVFNNQQPDIRSLYQLQAQPQFQIPQVPVPQLTQAQQPAIPNEMQMTSELLSSESQQDIRPASKWIDEDGRVRSEVLDGDRQDRQDDERPKDDRNEDYDDDDEVRHESSRYYDRDYDPGAEENDDDRAREDQTSDDQSEQPEQPEQPYSREEEGPLDEEGEDTEEPQDESTEDSTARTYGTNGPGAEDEQSPDEDDRDSQDVEPQQGSSSPQGNWQQFNPRPMAPFMAHPVQLPKFSAPMNTMIPTQLNAQTFSRYQLMSPSSAIKEHILPKPQNEPKPPPDNPHSDLKISQMSTAEAQFYENKAAMEPNFSPPIASKDIIPGKSHRFRFGLRNVLIRLNGKPLEDSSQLRSKIINGQIVQGKGKTIKSKGPIRVKLSHTKDAKHLKIIDILAPKQFQVYDTKSRIRRPTKNILNDANKTNTKMSLSDARRRIQT